MTGFQNWALKFIPLTIERVRQRLTILNLTCRRVESINNETETFLR